MICVPYVFCAGWHAATLASASKLDVDGRCYREAQNAICMNGGRVKPKIVSDVAFCDTSSNGADAVALRFRGCPSKV